MAESNASEESSNWWGSWITSAKAKSASVLEAVKKDLDEISSAVRTEVSNAGVMIGETLKLDEPESTANTVKRSLSSFIDQVTEVLVPSQEDEDAEAVLITSDGIVTLTGFQKHLAEVQMNEKTYLEEPDGHLAENYQRWLEVVEQDQFTQNRLTKHLSSSEILSEKYLSLVPEQVSNMEFWKRYLFKRAILEDALANAEIAERKAKAEQDSVKPMSPEKTIIQTDQPKKVIDDEELTELKSEVEEPVSSSTSKDDVKWDSEDFGTEEISEEEQARLLQEYEKEIQEREARKTESKVKQKPDDRKEQTKTNEKIANNKQTKNPTKTQRSDTNTKAATKKSGPMKTKTQTATSPDSTQTNDDRDSIVPIQKDHFSSESKDDTASDESWEKDFDITDK